MISSAIRPVKPDQKCEESKGTEKKVEKEEEGLPNHQRQLEARHETACLWSKCPQLCPLIAVDVSNKTNFKKTITSNSKQATAESSLGDKSPRIT